MVFVSTILGARVFDSGNEFVGEVKDILISIAQEREKAFPPVVGIVIRDQRTEKNGFVPVFAVHIWGKRIVLNEVIDKVKTDIPEGDEVVSLNNTVLDKQIVDLLGMRVVRVNDLQIGMVHNQMSLIAIDVSTNGMLRRLGICGTFINRVFKSHFVEWKNVRLVGNKLHLSTGARELVKFHPADIANILEKMNVREGSRLLQYMDHATAARVLEEIQPDIRKILINSLGLERAIAVMSKMSVDELVDLIQLLPGRAAREIVRKLPIDSKTQKIKRILEYDEDTAGGLMTTEFLAAESDTTVLQVIEKIRDVSHLHRSIYFVYIIDKHGKFRGVASLRNLIIADPKKKMKEIMKQAKTIPTVTAEEDLTAIAAILTKYNLLSVAVLDNRRVLIGIVTVDDIMRRLVPYA